MNDKSDKRKNTITGVTLILLIVLVLGVLAYSILGGDPPVASGGAPSGAPAASGGAPDGAPGAMPGMESGSGDTVYTVLAEETLSTTLKDYLKVNGDVEAGTSVDIYPDAAGKLTKLEISLGSYVRKGQIIAEVDPSIPGQVYVASPVRSTISGTVTDIPYEVGATISSTSVPVATVGDLANLQLVSYIAEKNMAEIELGQKADITFEPYGSEIFIGTVTEISPVLDKDSRTLEVMISLDESDSRIKSGMFGSVKLYTETREDVLVLSSDSIVSAASGIYVYVISGDDTVEQRFIETGLTVDGRTEILSGLSEGDIVVSRGQSMLQDGSSVKVAE
ncbi:MAG: efflux RND transporter periplasmic adaptor subunit [Spirochaetales bacterium]|nr:efflux RND transporter periplasmic adaptor subunit [Spirochaetales bacterium]